MTLRFSLLVMAISMITCRLLASTGDSLRAQAEYRSEGLTVIGVLIDNRGFFDEWKKPEMPKITSVDTFRRGDEVIPIILFSTTAKDPKGNATLTYSITISKPDGSVYGHYDNLAVWKDAPAPIMHLVQQPIVIRLEKTNPLGIYRIHAIVYENIRNERVPIDLAFRVVEDSVFTTEEMTRQLTFFYLKPNPLLLPTLMRSIEKAGTLEKENAQPAIMGFFISAMSSAPADTETIKSAINNLRESKTFFSACYSFCRSRDTVLNWRAHDASVNDMLWGAFFATGDRRIIERLVSEMRYCDEKESVYLYLTGASAKWSLCSNARQHPMVKAYLNEMVGKVTPALAGYLDEAIHSEPGTLREQMAKGVQSFKKNK